MESSINERVNSSLYSDVINSYVDINTITSQRNIVAGSFKETIQQCQDQTLSTLNAAAGQTLFTRLLLSPQVRNATLAQLAQIFFQFVIAKNKLAVMLAKQTSLNGNEVDKTTSTASKISFNEHLRFKLFYDTGASIASMLQLCLVADSKVSTENFNYQQSLLTLNSLPDYATKNSLTESTLSGLVENENSPGVGSGVIDVDLSTEEAGVWKINKDISIEGIIDLNKANPLFHNFPIITRNMGQLYVRLYMENFLRELKIVYLNKSCNVKQGTLSGASIANSTAISLVNNNDASAALDTDFGTTNKFTTSGAVNITGTFALTAAGPINYLPYQRLPADKPDFVYLDGQLVKVRLVVVPTIETELTGGEKYFKDFGPIYTLNSGITWTRFEIRKQEFDIEDFEDIKASQARAGVYKFPVHIWRSKNFDQTNAASSSANALQTTLNAPNIDRLFITQPWNSNYYTFLPTVPATDINPQLNNNPVLPRTEDALNTRTVERIGSVFVDTDKYTIPADLFNSLYLPVNNKQLYLKSKDTYGGEYSVSSLQRNHDIVNNKSLFNTSPIFIPNKFAYGLELNAGGCFRRGYNSVIDGNYSPTVPINLQQSVNTSDDIYKTSSADDETKIVNNKEFYGNVAYGNLSYSGATASVHCLSDYVFWFNFDNYGNMSDFGVSPYNDRTV